MDEDSLPANKVDEGKLFNVRPCRADPVFGLLKDRWNLSPIAGGGLFFGVYFVLSFVLAWLSGTAFPRPGLDLSFVQDRIEPVLCGFVVPVGAFLALRFYTQVEDAFERLYTEGVLEAPRDEYNQFLTRLDGQYNSVLIHVCALVLGLLVFGYLTYVGETDGRRSWLDLNMGPAAIYQLIVGTIAWYAAHLMLLKVLITAWAIQRVFDWPVNVQPLHPDGCGGLRLFTDIAITVAFFTATLGMAVVLIIMAGFILYGTPASPAPVLVAVLLETMTPLVFFSCLYRAHRVMRAAKADMLGRINQRFQAAFQQLQAHLSEADLQAPATDEVLRLQELHGMVSRLPVWPTNTQMVMQVALSVALPLGLLILQVLLERAVLPG